MNLPVFIFVYKFVKIIVSARKIFEFPNNVMHKIPNEIATRRKSKCRNVQIVGSQGTLYDA